MNLRHIRGTTSSTRSTSAINWIDGWSLIRRRICMSLRCKVSSGLDVDRERPSRLRAFGALTSGLQVSKVTVCKGRPVPLSRDYNKADLNPIGFEQDKAIPAFSGTRSMSDVNTKQQLMSRISELERRNAELEALDARRQSVEEALRDSEMRFRRC
jgi:hypothetical protein